MLPLFRLAGTNDFKISIGVGLNGSKHRSFVVTNADWNVRDAKELCVECCLGIGLQEDGHPRQDLSNELELGRL